MRRCGLTVSGGTGDGKIPCSIRGRSITTTSTGPCSECAHTAAHRVSARYVMMTSFGDRMNPALVCHRRFLSSMPVLPEGPSEVGQFLGTFSETTHSSK